jgi:hypothetical protein
MAFFLTGLEQSQESQYKLQIWEIMVTVNSVILQVNMTW